uniref:Uncharacterized protein n=1 Tax=Schizaphis graminum TaxID=13262 RepID=A0A2S2N8R0_SCHGA
MPERCVRRLRSVVGRQRGRRCRRRSGSATTASPGHRQNTVRLGERHIDDEAERQAAQEEIAMTVVRAAAARAGTTTTCSAPSPSAATAADLGPTTTEAAPQRPATRFPAAERL